MGRSTVNPSTAMFLVQIKFVKKNTKWTLFSVATQTVPLECTHKSFHLSGHIFRFRLQENKLSSGRSLRIVNFAFWQQKGPRTILFNKSDLTIKIILFITLTILPPSIYFYSTITRCDYSPNIIFIYFLRGRDYKSFSSLSREYICVTSMVSYQN